MSLSPLLVETYQRYKRDTNTFVTWLATTAKGIQNVDKLFSDTTTPNTQHAKGRLKGKERAKARAHEKISSTGKVTVPLASFESLATVVASAGVVVPAYICQILNGAIASRKECAVFYQGQGSDSECPNLSVDNDGHQHFIRLLEKVRSILPSTSPKSGPQKTSVGKDQASPDSNIFASLDPGYISDSEEVPSKKSSVHQSPLTKTYELEQPSKDNAEIAFAIFCVLKDMTDVRLFVHSTWRDYKEGKVNLVTAALTMNAATEIFQRVNAAFLEDFPDFDDHEKVIQFLYDGSVKGQNEQKGQEKQHEQHKQEGMEEQQQKEEHAGLQDHVGNYVVGDLRLSPSTFVCEQTLIRYFRNFLEQEVVITRSFTTREAPALLSSNAEHHHMNKIASFLQAWSGFVHPDAPVKQQHYDRLLYGICEVQKERKAYTWVVFALQTFIDMHRELGSEVGRGFEELKDTFAWLTAIFEDTLQICHSESRYTDPNTVNHLEKSLMHMKDMLKENELDNDTMDWNGGHFSFRGKMFYFKNNPMLCGWFMQESLQNLHDLGVEVAKWDNLIVSMMHVYNAGQQAGFLRPETKWADMEYLISQHGEDFLFIGGRPGLADHQPIKRYYISRGYSARGFLQNKRRPAETLIHTGKELRCLRNFSVYVRQVIKKIGKEFLTTDAQKDSHKLLERMVAAHLDSQAKAQNDNHRTQANAQRKMRVQSLRNGDLSPLQTLKIFKEAMRNDEFAIRFDMLTLFNTCYHLFSALQAIVQESPACNNDPLGSSMCETAGGLPGTSAYFMIVMAECPDWRMPMLKAWHVMQEIIDKVGNTSYLSATAQINVIASAPHPAYARSLLSPDQVFGGPNSPEHPGKWNNTTDQDNIAYLARVPYHGGAHELYPRQAQKMYSKRLARVVEAKASDRAVARLSAEFRYHKFIPVLRPKPAIPDKLEAVIHNPIKDLHAVMLQAFRKSLEREGPEEDDGEGLSVRLNGTDEMLVGGFGGTSGWAV